MVPFLKLQGWAVAPVNTTLDLLSSFMTPLVILYGEDMKNFLGQPPLLSGPLKPPLVALLSCLISG